MLNYLIQRLSRNLHFTITANTSDVLGVARSLLEKNLDLLTFDSSPLINNERAGQSSLSLHPHPHCTHPHVVGSVP